MPWKAMTPMLQREEFVGLARQEGANVSELCRRFAISRKTGYKWLGRSVSGREDWARERSRRPANSPNRVSQEREAQVLALRDEHPAWGGRKIRRRLEDLGSRDAPAASTITAILRRYGRIDPHESRKRGEMVRFEREHPNEMWQMDFKGSFQTTLKTCHPLTLVDDHSRYALGIVACADERAETVRTALTGVFSVYGLPERILMDNGACWGRVESLYTRLNAWLIRLGIRISHGRPYHPQTQGKNERFNRTLKDEALTGFHYHDLPDSQRGFDRFRHVYNHERPHDAIALNTPATRYRVSVFPFPKWLGPIEYLADDVVRRVGTAGYISYKKARHHIGRAFSGEPVALRATDKDGILAVYYCHQQIATVDLGEKPGVTD